MIKVYDNVSVVQNFDLYNFLLYQNAYVYGEKDKNEDDTPTGMVFDIKDPTLLEWFCNSAIQHHKELHNLKLARGYVNLFQPHERPHWHKDGNCGTCLFYVTPGYDIEENGETQFLEDGEIRGILPKKDRLIVFDGVLQHRATPFRNYPRITVALKYWK